MFMSVMKVVYVLLMLVLELYGELQVSVFISDWISQFVDVLFERNLYEGQFLNGVLKILSEMLY